MRMNQLGRTGLIVSELCLGTLTFGDSSGALANVGGVDLAFATQLLSRAVDGGINFIDTANVYADGESETIVGQALKSLEIPRSAVVIATKAMSAVGPGANDCGSSRAHLLTQIDASLRRLSTDYVDLYQLHGWDPLTPLDETLRALEDIVTSGRARYVGVSNWAAWQIMKALGIAERRGFNPLASVQAYYTIAGRDVEREIIPLIDSEGTGLLVYSPLAGGLLSGKYRARVLDENAEPGRRATFDFPPVVPERADALVETMQAMAGSRGISVAQIAIAWLLYRPQVTSVIIGAKRLSQLEDNMAACDVVLDTDDLALLDSMSQLPPEYPGWMFSMLSAYRAGMATPRRA